MSWQAKSIQEIKDAHIEHPIYANVSRECVARVNACERGDLLIILGGLRVGKTHLGEDVARILYGDIDPNAALQPFTIVTAANDGKDGAFSTADFTRAALQQVRHPLYSDHVLLAQSLPIKHSMDRRTEGEMRSELVRALLQRKTRTLILDEMQNLQYMAGDPAKKGWFLQSLKCAAYDAKVALFLIASYELLSILDQCEQVIARSDILHFPRYKASNDADLSAWEDILEAYGATIRFRRNDSLRKWNQVLFEHSLGCVGLLSRWLRAALATSEVAGASSLRLEHLLKSQRPPIRTGVLRDALEVGEEYLLGTDIDDTPAPEEKKARKRGRRPFVRNPRRVRPSDRLRAKT